MHYVGSRKIATEENYLPTLNPIQTLTLTGGQFSSGAIVRIPVCLKKKSLFKTIIVFTSIYFES